MSSCPTFSIVTIRHWDDLKRGRKSVPGIGATVCC